MKNIITLIAISLSMQLFAQEKEQDTMRFNVAGLEFIIINHGEDTLLVSGEGTSKEVEVGKSKKNKADDDLTYWSGFDFGPSILLNASGGNQINSPYLQMDPAQSFSYNLNFFEKRIRFGTDHVGLVTGMGLSFSRYGLKNNYQLKQSADSTWGTLDTLTSFNKNQLRATYLNVPLLLQFNSSKNEDKNFHVAAGVIGGVRIGSKLVQKFDVLGKESKNKSKGVYNLNSFQALATVRMGYNDFGLFANYNLLPLFEKGKAEQVFPLTMGVSFHF
ncbi:hypothetical protein DNU06_10290 [Putridiphycobacter roseus]|uniref:Outer membrane protein beta-barrel domain-containing protein n=1 Tax=Putridiphycobacter roseus TaxID=2219161 RepID=A0A2W1NDD4_9FLAO|nr:outer membrane beta-barrel protein [Putridiphycobacter roseus]PZE17123.1 hypothetical protein DNU06_10290 [Putridiphycobacter roseus]